MFMDDKEYWTEYYAKNSKPTDASSFAEFILPKLTENKNLIELGCGNGRDSKHHKEENILFVCDDFTNLANTESEDIKNTNFDYVYSRFTFHSINERKEDRTLDWIESNLCKGGCFLLEARSMNDPMFKQGRALSETENFTNHYRRYMDLAKIISKLESRNFEIVYKIEDNNLAVYKDDNPYVIRIVAKKL